MGDVKNDKGGVLIHVSGNAMPPLRGAIFFWLYRFGENDICQVACRYSKVFIVDWWQVSVRVHGAVISGPEWVLRK